MVNGLILGAVLKIPLDNDFRASYLPISSVRYTTLSPEEEKMCEFIALKLKSLGILLAGIDLINGKLIEINITSPGYLTELERLSPEGKRLILKTIDHFFGIK